MERERELEQPLERWRDRWSDDRLMLVEIGRFGIVGLREVENSVLDSLFSQRLADHKAVLTGEKWTRLDYVCLTPSGRRKARLRAAPGEIIQREHQTRSPFHDVLAYRRYRTFVRVAEAEGGTIRRVIPEAEFRSGLSRALWKSTDTLRDSRAYAEANHLPWQDASVQIPDVRIEWEDIDGRWKTEDIEVITRYSAAAVRAKKSGGFHLTTTRSGGTPWEN